MSTLADQILEELAAIREAAKSDAADREKLAQAVMGVVELQKADRESPAAKAVAAEVNAEEEAYREAVEKANVDRGRPARDLATVLGTKAVTDDERELQQLNDTARMALVLLGAKAAREGLPFNPTQLRSVQALNARMKALSTTGTATGDEYVPTGFSSNLQEEFRLERRVPGLFQRLPINRFPFDWPVAAGTGKPYLRGEPTVDTADNIKTRTPATRKVTFSGRTLAIRVLYSREFDEDSVVAAGPFTQNQIIMSLTDGLESAILNGDLTATHHDTAVTAADDHRRWCDGLRELATRPSTDTTLDMNTFSEANYNTLRGKMGKYMANPSDLAFIVTPGQLVKLCNTTNWPSFASLEKFGAAAANLTGYPAAVFGSPVVVSSELPTTEGTDGVDSGSTFSSCVIVNRTCYALALGRDITVEAAYDIETGQYKVVGSLRGDFEAWYDPTTETSVAVGYHI